MATEWPAFSPTIFEEWWRAKRAHPTKKKVVVEQAIVDAFRRLPDEDDDEGVETER